MIRKILFTLVGILSVSVLALSWQLDKVKTEKKRLSNNQETLLSDVEFYKTESGLNAASVQRLELTKAELERHNKELVSTISDLNLKIKRVQSATTTATESQYIIETIVRDSIIYRDIEPVRVQGINYRDPWIEFSGMIDSGIFSGNITTRDTLVQVVHRVPKQFLFIKWGTKAIRQEIVSKNPYSRITYNEYIELKK